MKIRLSQLKRIIKEEVKRTLREAPEAHYGLQDHERGDEARVMLKGAMGSWVKNPTPRSWGTIENSLRKLVDLEGMSDDEVMDEVGLLAGELGLSDDEMMDLDASVRDWLSGN